MPESLAKYSTDSERLEAAVRTEARALGESERQDAFSAGIVKGAAERAGEALATRDGSAGRGRAVSSKPSPAGAEKAKPKAHLASQAKGNLKRAIADAAVSEADDSEELSGIERAFRDRTARRLKEGACGLEGEGSSEGGSQAC